MLQFPFDGGQSVFDDATQLIVAQNTGNRPSFDTGHNTQHSSNTPSSQAGGQRVKTLLEAYAAVLVPHCLPHILRTPRSTSTHAQSHHRRQSEATNATPLSTSSSAIALAPSTRGVSTLQRHARSSLAAFLQPYAASSDAAAAAAIEEGNGFRQAAHDVLSFALTVPALQTVEALLDLAHVELAGGTWSGARLYSSMAIRMASDMGLHHVDVCHAMARNKEGANSDVQPLLWSCVVLELVLYFGTRYWPTLHVDCIEYEPPRGARTQAEQQQQHAVSSHQVRYTAASFVAELLLLHRSACALPHTQNVQAWSEAQHVTLRRLCTRLLDLQRRLPTYLWCDVTRLQKASRQHNCGHTFVLLHVLLTQTQLVLRVPTTITTAEVLRLAYACGGNNGGGSIRSDSPLHAYQHGDIIGDGNVGVMQASSSSSLIDRTPYLVGPTLYSGRTLLSEVQQRVQELGQPALSTMAVMASMDQRLATLQTMLFWCQRTLDDIAQRWKACVWAANALRVERAAMGLFDPMHNIYNEQSTVVYNNNTAQAQHLYQ